MYYKRYIFGNAAEGEESVRVKAEDYFEMERGYGLLSLDQAGPRADHFTGTGGWYPSRDTFPEMLNTDLGAAVSEREFPLRFRARVPEKGTYEVTVVLRAGKEGCERVEKDGWPTGRGIRAKL